MDDLATIGYKADLSGLNKLNAGLNRVGAAGSKTAQQMDNSMTKVTASVKKVGAAIVVAYAAMETVNKQLSVARGFDVLNAQLVTATGSADNAATAFMGLQSFAASTPYDLQQTTKAFAQLVNLGLTPSSEALESYGNTAAAMGKDLSQLVEAVADATTGEFERLKEFGIKSSSEGDRVSFTFRGMTKTVGKNAAEIEQYIMNLGQNEFGGAMEERAKTLDGALSNLGDTWDALFLSMSNAGISDIIESVVRGTTDLIQGATDIINSGVIGHLAETLALPFQGMAESLSSAFNFVTGFIGESTSGWWDSFKTFIGNLTVNIMYIPETIKSMIIRTGMELSALGEVALIYGDAFVETLKTSFNKTVDIAGVYGQKLASVLNPLADEYDLTANLSVVSQAYAGTFKDISDSADQAIDIVITNLNQETSAIKQGLQEQKDNYKERILLSDDIVAAYVAEREAAQDAASAALGSFKVKPTKSSSSSDVDEDFYKEFINGSSEALAAIQDLTENGSSEYEKLTLAIQAAATAQALLSGNYLGAAASAISMLSVSDIEATFKAAQDEQGLNEWNEKASSIDYSVSSMESNTSKLVGINTDMLDALTTLQSDLLSAAGIVARDVTTPTANANFESNLLDNFGWVSFTDVLGDNIIGQVLDFVSFNWLFDSIGGILGGSSKVSDEGIQILSGSISDLISDTTVLAFQDVKYKKWALGSTKTKTATEDISSAVGNQFEAVFGSLADTVFSGASALGLNSSAITSAINGFVIDTIDISLKDLSVDEQSEALEDVFSQVFNNLTEAVIPWLDELQDTGEDLGETLSRVATEVSIANLLIEQVGVSFGRLSTKNFAFAADNIATLAGGVDDLADSVSSFIDSFASDETKLEIYSDAVSDALSAVGLALPDSAEGFWDLASTINASTEAGQEQIATLLNITDTAAEYYDLLESTEESLNDLSDSFVSTILDIYDLSEATEAMSLDAALAAARLGDFSLAEALDSSDYNLTASNYATKAAYDIAQAEAANKLLEIAELAADETSVEEEQLSVLMQINESIIAGYGNQGSATMTSEISSLNAIMTKTQELSEAAVRLNAKMSSNLDRIARVGIPTYE